MKFQKTKRFLAAALAAALLAPAVLAAGFGAFLRQDGIELSDTARMVRSVRSLSAGGQVTEHLITYAPEAGLRPMVGYGTTLYGRSDINYVASYMAGTGRTVAAGINGSFFTMANGIPIGSIVTEGVVRSASVTGNAVGFFADGSAIIGQPRIDLKISYPNGETGSAHYNKVLNTKNGAVLYSNDFDKETKNTISAYNVVLRPSSDRITLGGTLTATVTAVYPAVKSCAIPAGCFVLSMATETDYAYTLQHQLATLKTGDTVTIACTVDAAWQNAAYICGGDELLVENGAARTAFTLDSARSHVARTAVGLRRDGTLVLYTVDSGGSGYSAGMSLAELAARMAELECVTALNLDGGGSTTFSARLPGDAALTNLNRPSDGSLRKCANFIFLARDAAAAGPAAHLHLYPYDAAMLAGARMTMSVKATDASYNPAAVPAGLTYTATGGAVTDAGVFTAGRTAGTANVHVQVPGGAAGSRTVRIVTEPSAVSLKNEATGQAVSAATVAAGKSLNLSAAAAFAGYSLIAQDDCFTWSVSGNIGTIDPNGVFTAAELTAAASGTITCAAGAAKATVQVSVTPLQPEGGAVHGFEAGDLRADSGTGLVVAGNQDLNYVRYGGASLQARYDLSQGSQVQAGLRAALPEDTDTVGLWVYGDGSGNSLSLLFDAEESSKWLTQLNFTGWKYATLEVPAGATAVTGFAVTAYEGASAAAGTIYLDQLIAARGALRDETPPLIQTAQTATALQISVSDADSGVERVEAAIDGTAQTLSVQNGAASLPLPNDGQAHQVRVTAADRCGNLASATVAITGTLADPFSDLEGHWAKAYVDYCNRQGILSGSQDAAGNLRYRPDDSMTRQEFAVALIRFLGVDTARYQDTELPFSDAAAIADWAEDAMKAAYALGLITGARSGSALCANPAQTITRQEAMVILGRTQTKGYAADPLTSFSDAGSVDAWAREHIACMVSRGIISGSHGQLLPRGQVTRGQVAKILYCLY